MGEVQIAAGNPAGFTGIDTGRAAALVTALRAVPGAASEVAATVAIAETLSELDSGTRARLAEIGSNATGMANAIDQAASALAAHRLAVWVQVDRPTVNRGRADHGVHPHPAGTGIAVDELSGVPLARRGSGSDEAPTAIITETRDRGVDSEPAYPGRAWKYGLDPDRQTMFEAVFEDPTVAAAVASLVANGLPLGDALGLDSLRDVDALFEATHQAMVDRRTPSQAGVDPSLFPPQYIEWHRHFAALDPSAGRETLGLDDDGPGNPRAGRDTGGLDNDTARELLDRLNRPLAIVGLDNARHRLDMATERLDEWAVINTVAAHNGWPAQRWAGAKLVDHIGQTGPAGPRGPTGPTGHLGHTGGTGRSEPVGPAGQTDRLETIAGIVAANEWAAVGFFNRLGAFGTAHLPDTVTSLVEAQGTDQAVLAGLAAGLAAATTTQHLDFGGADLIDAFELRSGPPAELLLLASGFDPVFRHDALVASLQAVAADREVSSRDRHDRRGIVLHVIGRDGLAEPILRSGAGSGRIGAWLGGSMTDEGLPRFERHTLTGASRSETLVIGWEPSGLTDWLDSAGQYRGFAPFQSQEDHLIELATRSPELAVLVVAAAAEYGSNFEGLEELTALTLPELAHTPEATEAALSTLEILIADGKGNLVVDSLVLLAESEIRTQLRDGSAEIDFARIEPLGAEIERLWGAHAYARARDADFGADRLNDVLTMLGYAVMVGGPKAAAAGTVLSVLSPLIEADTRHEDRLLEDDFYRKVLQDNAIAATLVQMAFDDRRVVTAQGDPVELTERPRSGGYELTNAHTGEAIFVGALDEQAAMNTLEALHLVGRDETVPLGRSLTAVSAFADLLDRSFLDGKRHNDKDRPDS